MIRTSAERDIAAPAERVYRILSDYSTHHRHILPTAFTSFEVEQGGIGVGTVIRYSLRAGGRTFNYHQRIEEPEPGRVLVEQDLDSDLATSFTVTPTAEGCRVKIETTWTSTGIKGFVERFAAPRMLKPIYAAELDLLDQYARAHPEL